MPSHAKMTGWYDPLRLIAIATRVAISTVFGEFADRRESMAMAREIDPAGIDPAYDYTQEQDGDFWLDFIADTGDGWDSTYAMARLLASPELPVAGSDQVLRRGRVLVMGGDQVYPTASRDNYRMKLIAPFDQAARGADWTGAEADLYAIPGNHDWYDGLVSFIALFCRRRLPSSWSEGRRGRVIGGRHSKQTRSYFALALPHGWWLWGLDIQLEGYIDQAQVDFFDHVARHWMPPNSHLILCTGQPDWVYVDVNEPRRSTFGNFSYMERLAELANPGNRLRLVLTGDSHHYSRYTEAGINYITAGGGGAFLHPTHQLTDKSFEWDYPPPGSGSERRGLYRRNFQIARDSKTNEPALFPRPSVSRKLAFRNLAFWYWNPQFALTLGTFYALYAWLLHTNAEIRHVSMQQALQGSGFPDLAQYLDLAVVTPWPAMFALAVLVGCVYFADFVPVWKRCLAGFVHWFAQISLAVLIPLALAGWGPIQQSSVLLVVCIGVLGGLAAPTVMGIYLLGCVNIFGRHWNEAFSALRIADYKNFLRLRIASDGTLTVFPVALERVPRNGRRDVQDASMHPHLIEAPIEIQSS